MLSFILIFNVLYTQCQWVFYFLNIKYAKHCLIYCCFASLLLHMLVVVNMHFVFFEYTNGTRVDDWFFCQSSLFLVSSSKKTPHTIHTSKQQHRRETDDDDTITRKRFKYWQKLVCNFFFFIFSFLCFFIFFLEFFYYYLFLDEDQTTILQILQRRRHKSWEISEWNFFSSFCVIFFTFYSSVIWFSGVILWLITFFC